MTFCHRLRAVLARAILVTLLAGLAAATAAPEQAPAEAYSSFGLTTPTDRVQAQ